MYDIEGAIGYKFKNKVLLKTALTHSSYANENRAKKLKSNERLEFLGDSVLGFLTADHLLRNYPNLPEGDLTKIRAAIVCEQSLFEVSKLMHISEGIILGCGEEQGGGRHRPSILADAVEAILGAVYLDGGIEAAAEIVTRFVLPRAALAVEGHAAFKDYKTKLQEIVQKNREEVLSYRLKGVSGPDHDKRFEVELLLNSNVIAKGKGKSKKEAEQMAAKEALSLMGQ